VTTAINVLKERHTIATERRFIAMTDRVALARVSNGAY